MVSRYTNKQLFVLEKQEITCKDVVEVFGEYSEGALPPTLCARVDEHLDGCGDCQKFSREYALTIQLARELSSRPVPSGVDTRLREALNRRLGINLAVRS